MRIEDLWQPQSPDFQQYLTERRGAELACAIWLPEATLVPGGILPVRILFQNTGDCDMRLDRRLFPGGTFSLDLRTPEGDVVDLFGEGCPPSIRADDLVYLPPHYIWGREEGLPYQFIADVIRISRTGGQRQRGRRGKGPTLTPGRYGLKAIAGPWRLSWHDKHTPELRTDGVVSPEVEFDVLQG